MVNTLTPIEMLNRTLEWFATDFKDMGMGEDAKVRDRLEHYQAEGLIMNKYPELHTNEFLEYSMLIFQQLVDDGYLTLDDKKYSINFKGKLFSQSGGYIQKAVNDESDRALKDSRDKRLSNGTVLLAIGTFLLVAWEIVKTLWIEKHCN